MLVKLVDPYTGKTDNKEHALTGHIMHRLDTTLIDRAGRLEEMSAKVDVVAKTLSRMLNILADRGAITATDINNLLDGYNSGGVVFVPEHLSKLTEVK